MYASIVLACTLAATTSVLGSPNPVVKRAPVPKLIYASDFAEPTSAAALEKRTFSECQAVDFVVDALKFVSKAAYPFCSSYIHIPVVTSTISKTTTITPSPVSVTATVTPATVTISSTATVTITNSASTSTVYSHYTPPAAKDKRAKPTVPPYLSAFAASAISKACSCLTIPASTTTVCTTVSQTLPASTITATTVTAATPTTTVVVSTSTVTVPVATTTIPALCAPSVLSMTSGVLSTAGNDQPNLVTKSSITDIASCCASCLGTTNCLSYFLSAGSCDLFIAVDPSSPSTGNAAQNAICPLGVDAQDTIFPPGVSAPESGDGAFHIGPCLTDATPYI